MQYFFCVEHSFECPYCGEEISMVLDTSVARQTYIEDCEVCCRPIEITYVVEDGELVEFGATRLRQGFGAARPVFIEASARQGERNGANDKAEAKAKAEEKERSLTTEAPFGFAPFGFAQGRRRGRGGTENSKSKSGQPPD